MKSTQTQLFLLLLLLISASCSDKNAKKILAPPVAEKAIFYHLNVRDFSPEGTFKAILPRLAALKALGVNTLVLAPIHPIGLTNRQGSLGSVYASTDYKGIHADLGTAADFQTLVDSCHANGLYLLMEWDGSVAAADHPWKTAHPDWFLSDSGYYPLAAKSDLSLLNTNQPQLQTELSQNLRYWIETYQVDGFYARKPTALPTNWWTATLTELRKIKPLLVIAGTADNQLKEAGFDLIAFPDVTELVPQLLNFNKLENQTQAREMAIQLAAYPNHFHSLSAPGWDKTIEPPLLKYGNRKAAMVAFMMSTILPGNLFLVAGEEVGHATPLLPFDKNRLLWSTNADIQSFYSTLLQLRSSETAFEDAAFAYDSLSNPKVMLFRRGQGLNTLYVLVNPSDSLATVQIPVALQGKRFTDRFTGLSVLLEKELLMLEYSFYLLKEEAAS